MAEPLVREKEYVDLLLKLTLNPANAGEVVPTVEKFNAQERQEFLAFANSHHVVLRSFESLLQAVPAPGADLTEWLEACIVAEHERIGIALKFLSQICDELESAGCPTVVMKSLDHWPDLGNDLDLYTTGGEAAVQKTIIGKFNAKQEAPSWGDRLAHKCNFEVPGLRELVEVHVQRLGQTGEHTEMARRFVSRRVPLELNGYRFLVPAPEERVIVATLQRMYRHFYARVCDIVNVAKLVESRVIDYNELKVASESGGIWPGVATFLMIVSDYVRQYRGTGLELPVMVARAARFGGDQVVTRKKFLRIPMFPQGAVLYTKQLTNTALRGETAAAFRLSLLPGLASVAAVAAKLTGSDKGIW
jgi:hypothetical protein